MKISAIAVASALVLAAGSAGAVTYIVPGTSDPFLAGASAGNSVDFNGVIDANTDYAPTESPVSVSVTAGETYSIFAITDPALGRVGNCGGCNLSGPAGDSGYYINSTPFTTTGFTALVSGFPAALPINSLVGVFNGSIPSVVAIGSSGTFTAPAGATTLYLGTVDGYQWNNNVGGFLVNVGVVPEPASWALMLVGFGAMGVALRSRRKIAAATV